MIDKAALRKLTEEASPSPWSVIEDRCNAPGCGDSYTVVDADNMSVADVGQAPQDAAFIAAARTAVPELLSALDAAEVECERLRGRLHDRCTCEHGDPSRRILEHDKDCPIRVNIRTRIAPEVALARFAAAFNSSDEVKGLEAQLAATTAARNDACDIAERWICDKPRIGDRARIAALRAKGGGK